MFWQAHFNVGLNYQGGLDVPKVSLGKITARNAAPDKSTRMDQTVELRSKTDFKQVRQDAGTAGVFRTADCEMPYVA